MVVAADSPIKSLDDLIAKFKADPGSVSWGGFALGSPDHILSGLIVKAAGGDVTKMNYIVAGAGGEMLAQVMGGHLTVATGGLNELAQQIQAGKLRALGISSPERLPGVDIPTFKEQGVDVTLVNWRGLMAPGQDEAGREEGTRRGHGGDGQERRLAGPAQGARLGRPVPAGRRVRGVPRALSAPGSRASSRISAWCSDGREETMTTGSGLRIGEAILGGVVLGLGLFIAFETSMLEVAASNAAIGPRLFPYLIAAGLVIVGALVLREAFFGHIAHEGGFELDWRAVALVSAGLILQMLLLETPGLDHRHHPPVRGGDPGLRQPAAPDRASPSASR